MTLDTLYDLIWQTLWLTLVLIGPPVLAVFVVGVLFSLLGSTMQIHDPVFSFVPKLVAAVLALVIASPWIWDQLLDFTRLLWMNLHR